MKKIPKIYLWYQPCFDKYAQEYFEIPDPTSGFYIQRFYKKTDFLYRKNDIVCFAGGNVNFVVAKCFHDPKRNQWEIEVHLSDTSHGNHDAYKKHLEENWTTQAP